MSQMKIEVEFLAGTCLETAVEEAKAKAAMLDIAYVEFPFNGIKFCIGRNADLTSVMAEWHDICASKSPAKFICHS